MSKFIVGEVVGDGTIQRWIFALHGDGFEDSHRINGDFVLTEMPLSAIPDSEWEIDEERASEYAAKQGPFPPIVLDQHLSFIDGGHRHRAAQIRGDETIQAFVPAGKTVGK